MSEDSTMSQQHGLSILLFLKLMSLRNYIAKKQNYEACEASENSNYVLITSPMHIHFLHTSVIVMMPRRQAAKKGKGKEVQHPAPAPQAEALTSAVQQLRHAASDVLEDFRLPLAQSQTVNIAFPWRPNLIVI